MKTSNSGQHPVSKSQLRAPTTPQRRQSGAAHAETLSLTRPLIHRCGRILLGLLAWSALLSVASGAWAQQGSPPDLETMIEKRQFEEKTKEQEAEENLKVKPPEEDPIQIDVQWNLRRGADNAEAKDRYTDSVFVLGEKLGIPNHPYKARVLLEEASEMATKGKYSRANTLIAQARRLAPALPVVEFSQVALTLETQPWNIVRLVGQLMVAYGKSWSFLPARFVWMTNGLVAVWLALMLLGAALVVISSRHMGLLAMEIKHFLPDGVTRVQVMLLLLLLILAPALLTRSLMVSAVVLVVLLGVYMTLAERIMVTVVLGLMALMPQIMNFGAAGLQYPGTELSKVATWTTTGCLSDCRQAIKEFKSKEGAKADPRLKHTMELLELGARLRRGPHQEWPDVLKGLEKLAAEPTLPIDHKMATSNYLGIAQALTGKFKEADLSFSRAARSDAGNFGFYHNLFRVMELSGDGTKAERALKKAIELGSDEAARRSQSPDRVVSSWFYMAPLSAAPLFDLHMERALSGADDEDSPAQAYWSRIGGDLPLESMPLMAGGALAALWALSLLGRVAGASEHCPRCGGQMNPNHDGLTGQEGDTCRACHHYFGGGQMSYNERVQHEATLNWHETWRKVAFWAGNLLLPGAGSALCGTAVGLIGVVLVGSAAALLLTGGEPLPEAWKVLELWTDGREVVGGLMLIVAFLLSMALLWLGMPEYIAPPKAPISRPPQEFSDNDQDQFDDGFYDEGGDEPGSY